MFAKDLRFRCLWDGRKNPDNLQSERLASISQIIFFILTLPVASCVPYISLQKKSRMMEYITRLSNCL